MNPKSTLRFFRTSILAVPPAALLILVSLTLCPANLFAQYKAGHPSLGICTQGDEFHTRQQAMDVKVQAFTGAKETETRQAALDALVAAADPDIECLIRYREAALLPVFSTILAGDLPWHLRAKAAYALKMLRDEAAVPALAKGLADGDSMVREACASALGHIGGPAATAALKERQASEQDPYVVATLTAMLASAQAPPAAARKDGKVWQETLEGPDGARRVAFDWTVKGASLWTDFEAKAVETPVADKFVYPIQRYQEDLFAGYPRRSFGGKSGHAGEDCAWFRDGCGIYSIAAGVVRMINSAGGDWGFLVLVEHRLADGRYLTSAYGHMGADVLVKPGDVVACGQRIGSQGLSCSVENGGYGGHLHFGLANGPFRQPPGLAAGDQAKLNDTDQTVPVLRLVYGKNTNRYGRLLTAFVVRMPDGGERTIEVPEQPIQQEVGWFVAYVKDCRGWLNPQEKLPDLVAGKLP